MASLRVGCQLVWSAVSMAVAGRAGMFGLMGILGDIGHAGGRGDVRDRGDVVPIDSMAQAENEGGYEQSDCRWVQHGAMLLHVVASASAHASGYACAEMAAQRPVDWPDVAGRLRARGMRWTPQRRLLLGVLSRAEGHITAAELIERCRAEDPLTTPSTVYRTLDLLEELGLVRHAHGVDGREEYHVLPDQEHGHLHCAGCGGSWEIAADEAGALVASLHSERGFAVDLSHLTVVGTCAGCQDKT